MGLPRIALSRIGVALALAVGALLAGAVPAAASGNDYPYSAQSNPDAVDPWGFYQRQCVSFVAWRSHQRGVDLVSNGRTPWGNASHWDEQAHALRKAVDHTPSVGAIAHWNEYEDDAGRYGHVAYVSAVHADGSVTIEDYNGAGGSRKYGTSRVDADDVPRFIHYAG